MNQKINLLFGLEEETKWFDFEILLKSASYLKNSIFIVLNISFKVNVKK